MTAQEIFADRHSIAGDELRSQTSDALYGAAELAVADGDAQSALRLGYYAGMAEILEDM